MTNPVYIVDIIGDVVNNVRDEILQTIITNENAALAPDEQSFINTINYQYGHKLELLETLKQMDQDASGQNKFLKYPLVYLVQDFVEDRGKQPGIYAETSLNILIMHQTEPTHKITDRYNKVFKPVLYPIYYSLINQINQSRFVNQGNEDLIPHTKIDRAFYGKKGLGGNEKNALNDFVDAIEIVNLDLKINYQPCLV